MFSLVRHLGLEQAIRREGIPLGGAWLIAELFYKFHSFTLECVAFLATWFALSAIFFGVRRMLGTAEPRA
jgi:hypothetical protein